MKRKKRRPLKKDEKAVSILVIHPLGHAAILAGGRSRRMGQDKAGLHIGGEPLLLRVVHVLQALPSEVVIIGPRERAALAPGIPIIADRWPNCGPLGGIASALAACSQESVLVVGCDMPFLNAPLLRYLTELVPGYDAVVVRVDGREHTLHAVYQRRCLPVLEKQLAAGNLRVRDFLKQLEVRFVEGLDLERFDPTHLSVFNVNTPEEWQQALRMLAAKKKYI